MVKNLPAIQETQDTRVRFWVGKIFQEGMTTHSSILAWRIPWIRLQSMGLQRVRYD